MGDLNTTYDSYLDTTTICYRYAVTYFVKLPVSAIGLRLSSLI